MDKKKTITVFTPTYNRAYCLHQLYDSLVRQTSNDFLWLIIDDGSIDNTKELVGSWINESHIEIRYVYKENGGMHTGHNLAYNIIDTELNVCIDSDDFMPDNAIELILNKWKSVENRQDYAGIIGLDAFKDGSIVGTKIPKGLTNGNLNDLYKKHGVKGDKKVVLRTDIVKKYPIYPEYPNEKLVPLGVLYTMIGVDYPSLYVNDVYCIVEYQLDGSTNTIFKQYKQSSRGFAYARKTDIRFSNSITDTLRGYIHLVSSSIFAKDFSLALKDVNPVISVIVSPFGFLLNLYIRYKIKKNG